MQTCDGDCSLIFGEDNEIGNNNSFYVLEHGTIKFYNNILSSTGCTFRNSDAHVICNEFKKRINLAQDIQIDDHVWLGQGVTVLKGVHINKDTVIGANSVVTRDCKKSSVYAGTPAKCLKSNIYWKKDRN